MKNSDNNSNNQVALLSLYSSDAFGPRYISSLLKENGIDVTLVFFKDKKLGADTLSYPSDNEYSLLLDFLKDLKPSVLGISFRSSYYRFAKIITEKIRRELDMPIVWGGSHPSVAPEECIKTADIVCVGEGEFPMLDLVNNISEGKSPDEIQNLWIKKGADVIRSPVRPPVTDLDSLPFPDYGKQGKYLIEDNEIIMHDPALDRFNADIMASRGCPFSCTYCCNSIFREMYRGKGPPARKRSVGNVIDEILYVREINPNLQRVDFQDEVFAWEKKWAFEFSERYEAEVHLPFQCFQHPNMVDNEITARLRKAGLERVDVGIQSGSERIRREIYERPVSDDAFLRAASIMKQNKLTPFYDYIIDNPFETEEDKRLGLEFLLKIPRPFYLRMAPLIFFPNTAITKRALETKAITEDQVESKLERTHYNWLVTLDYPWSTAERFWISLFSLTSKRFIPKRLIRWLSCSKYLRKRPKILSAFAKFANNIKLGLIALRWLREGRSLRNISHETRKGRSHWLI